MKSSSLESIRTGRALVVALVGATVLSLACTGQIGDPQNSLCTNCSPETGGPGAGGGQSGPGGTSNAGGTQVGGANGGGTSSGGTNSGGAAPLGVAPSTRLPRLSHTQWENTVKDLLRLDAVPGLSTGFPPDPTTQFDTNVEQKGVSNLHWAAYQTAAEEVAQQVAQDPQKLAKILPPGLPGGGIERARAFVQGFGRRAFRRPLTEAEIGGYAALFEKGVELVGGDPLAAGVQLALHAFLQSPAFLYRVEASTKASGDRVWLGGFEVASRLSYALWNSMPSDELLDAAEAGELADAAGVEKWARALLKDGRATAVLTSFHNQLFETAGYGKVTKSSSLFPEFTKDLEPLLKQEARLFFEEVVAKQQGGLREVLTSPVTFVNDKLAPFYGLPAGVGPEFKKVELDPKQRAGVMTQVGFLSKNGGLVQSDPIHRGVTINLKILCEKLTAPNMIPPLPEQKPGQTNRERVAAHTEGCGKGCHDTKINPIGFAFEHFDTVGAWRSTDNGQPVDAKASMKIDGEVKSFDGAPGLMNVLASSAQVHRCYSRNWMEYALGRQPGEVERGWVEQLAESSRSGAAATEILVKLAVSDVFRARPVEGGAP